MISLMLFTLTACGSEDPAEEISRALHIDVSAGEEISSSDTHGGFHGDGISCVALQFPDSQVAANGFYRLIDRHSDAGDGQNLLERASLNVTLAVYDADSDTLYFCEMDT